MVYFIVERIAELANPVKQVNYFKLFKLYKFKKNPGLIINFLSVKQ
jgi:hypothetical protein